MDDALAKAQQPHVFSFVSERSPSVHCTLTHELPKMGAPLFHSGLTWRLHDSTDGYTLCMHRGKNDDVYQKMWLSKDFSRAQLNASSDTNLESDAFFSVDGPLFQLWSSFLLNQSRGVLLHALAVKKDGQAYLFPGKSGVGKSTLARLVTDSNVGQILSDDRVVLRREKETFRVYGTPWNGEPQHHLADDAPLKTIYFPEQTPTCSLDVVPVAEAASHLFASSSVAGWPRPDAMRFVLDTAGAVAESAVSYRFGFTPNRGALRTLGWL